MIIRPRANVSWTACLLLVVSACTVPISPPSSRYRLGPAHPRGRAVVEIAPVVFRHETHPPAGPTLRLGDETDATLVRVHLEGGEPEAGGGIALEYTTVDDDLHTNIGLTSSDVGMVDVFPYFFSQVQHERFRMPSRIGPYLHFTDFEFLGPGGRAQFDYRSFGIRLELEPEIDLFQADAMAVSIFGAANVGIGLTLIDLGSSEDFTTSHVPYGLRTGVRWTAGNFIASLAYYHSVSHFAQSDPEVVGGSLTVAEESDFTQSGILFTAGARW